MALMAAWYMPASIFLLGQMMLTLAVHMSISGSQNCNTDVARRTACGALPNMERLRTYYLQQVESKDSGRKEWSREAHDRIRVDVVVKTECIQLIDCAYYAPQCQ